MSYAIDPREINLPRWARDSLLSIRNKLAEHERVISVARRDAYTAGASGKVVVSDLLDSPFPLNDHASVEFHLPDGKIACRLREGGKLLDINASNSLLILPRAANCAYARVEY